MFKCVNSSLPANTVDLADVSEAVMIAVGPITPERFIGYAKTHECLEPLLDKLGYNDLAINSDLTGAELMANDTASYCWISRYQGVPALMFTHAEIHHIFISENAVIFDKDDAALRQDAILQLQHDFLENYYQASFDRDFDDLKLCFANFINANGDQLQAQRIPLQLFVPDNFQNSLEFARSLDDKLLPDNDGVFTKYHGLPELRARLKISMFL